MDPLRRVRECLGRVLSLSLSVFFFEAQQRWIHCDACESAWVLSPSLPSRPVPHLHPLPPPSLLLTPPSPPHPLRIPSPSPPPLAAIFLAPARCCEELLSSESCAWKLIRTDVVRQKKKTDVVLTWSAGHAAALLRGMGQKAYVRDRIFEGRGCGCDVKVHTSVGRMFRSP
jgi:hypothetical protein